MRKIRFNRFEKKDYFLSWLIPDLRKTIESNIDNLMKLEFDMSEKGQEYPLAYEVIEFIKSLGFKIQYLEHYAADSLASRERFVKIPICTQPLDSNQYNFETTREKQSVSVGDLILEIIED